MFCMAGGLPVAPGAVVSGMAGILRRRAAPVAPGGRETVDGWPVPRAAARTGRRGGVSARAAARQARAGLDRGIQAGRVRGAASGEIEGGAVVDRDPWPGQAQGQVDRTL